MTTGYPQLSRCLVPLLLHPTEYHWNWPFEGPRVNQTLQGGEPAHSKAFPFHIGNELVLRVLAMILHGAG